LPTLHPDFALHCPFLLVLVLEQPFSSRLASAQKFLPVLAINPPLYSRTQQRQAHSSVVIPSLKMDPTVENRRQAFVVFRPIFKKENGAVSHRSLRKLVQCEPSLQSLRATLTHATMMKVLWDMLRRGVFQSERLAKLEFPDLFENESQPKRTRAHTNRQHVVNEPAEGGAAGISNEDRGVGAAATGKEKSNHEITPGKHTNFYHQAHPIQAIPMTGRQDRNWTQQPCPIMPSMSSRLPPNDSSRTPASSLRGSGCRTFSRVEATSIPRQSR